MQWCLVLACRNIATINDSSVVCWISVSTVKELFASIDCLLDKHSNTLKPVSMSWNLMPKVLCQTTLELEAIVDGLLPVTNVLLHVFSLFQICGATGDLQHWGCSPTYPSSASTLSFGARWLFSEFLKMLISDHNPHS